MLALNRKQGGYTLLEILITLAVVAIVASLAVPSFQNMIATQRVRSAANDLVATLNFARSEAVKRNATVTITPAAGGWTDGWTTASGGTTLRVQDGYEGITLTGDPASTPLSYGGDGRRNGSDVEIEIEPPSGSGAPSYCIEMSATGKPSSKSGSC
ncbi:type IV fimbrial biogenesis protein FimT [Litorivivens lipolytica]|uniref:Type II secretion system protein H n=1 Tax=Litorivivens lipolytica TaxID=1524264 RepID=A0A7W4Z732_9GAMM|nr:GspH/FimT family pseudopilin [Litorivivens lipolytica]MBB3047506.1 type IV fimbrial biogenesis protein FimT [Litorivivens lipolytica]